MQSPSSWTAGELPWSPLKKKKNWAGRTLKRTKTSLMWLLGEGEHWRSDGPGSQSCCLSCARSCPRVPLPGTQEGKTKMATGKTGSTEIWTRIAGFKVQSANHYTMGPTREAFEKVSLVANIHLWCTRCQLSKFKQRDPHPQPSNKIVPSGGVILKMCGCFGCLTWLSGTTGFQVRARCWKSSDTQDIPIPRIIRRTAWLL